MRSRRHPQSGDIMLFRLTERPDRNTVVMYGTHRSSHGPVAGAEAICRDVGKGPGPGPGPEAPQTRPEAEADGVSSMMFPHTGSERRAIYNPGTSLKERVK